MQKVGNETLKKSFNIELDLINPYLDEKPKFSQNDYDSIEFIFAITNNGEPIDVTEATVQLVTKSPLRKTSIIDCIVDGNIVTVTLGTSMYSTLGFYDGQLVIYQNGKVLNTSKFSYYSSEAILNDDTVQSQNEYQAINKTVEELLIMQEQLNRQHEQILQILNDGGIEIPDEDVSSNEDYQKLVDDIETLQNRLEELTSNLSNNYYTKEQVVNLIPDYTQVFNEIQLSITNLNSRAATIEQELGLKANLIDVYTKTEMDNKLDTKYVSLSKLQIILSDYYTKAEIDAIFSSMHSAVHILGRIDSADLLPTENNEIGDIFFVGTLDEEYTFMYIYSSVGWKKLASGSESELIDLISINTIVESTDINLETKDSRFVKANGSIVDASNFDSDVILYDLTEETLPPIISATDTKGFVAIIPNGGNPFDCFDSSESSYGYVAKASTWDSAMIILGFPQMEYIQSINFTPTVNSTYSPTKTQIEISVNGVDYVVIQTIAGKLVSENQYSFVLDTPVLAKYMRLNFVSGASTTDVGANIGIRNWHFTTFADSTKKRLPYKENSADSYFFYKVKGDIGYSSKCYVETVNGKEPIVGNVVVTAENIPISLTDDRNVSVEIGRLGNSVKTSSFMVHVNGQQTHWNQNDPNTKFTPSEVGKWCSIPAKASSIVNTNNSGVVGTYVEVLEGIDDVKGVQLVEGLSDFVDTISFEVVAMLDNRQWYDTSLRLICYHPSATEDEIKADSLNFGGNIELLMQYDFNASNGQRNATISARDLYTSTINKATGEITIRDGWMLCFQMYTNNTNDYISDKSYVVITFRHK